MQAAGDDVDCIAYLMGNNLIAERRSGTDPPALLCAPSNRDLGRLSG